MGSASLLVIQGPDQGIRFVLDRRPAGIGRGVRNHVRLNDTEVSRQHALLEQSGDRYRVTDTSSANGTLVNGTAIPTSELTSGDRIQVGRTVLVFTALTAPADEHAASHVDLVDRDTGDQSSIVEQVDTHASDDLVRDATQFSAPVADRTFENLQTLFQILEEAAVPSSALQPQLQRILNLTIAAVGAQEGCVLLRDNEAGTLEPTVYGRGGPLSSESADPMPVSRTIVDYVIQHGQGVRTSDAPRDERFQDGQSILQSGIREVICVPMNAQADTVGVIYLQNTTKGTVATGLAEIREALNEDHLRLVLAIGRHAALAVQSSHFQQALVKAERLAAVGETITVLSHHIKNILQGIRGGSYLIEMGLDQAANDTIRNGWSIVERNQRRIYDLVMDMLSYSRERVPSLERRPLNDTIAEVCELITPRASESGVRLDTELSQQLPETLFDPEGIHRAILNIAINAVEAVEGATDARVVITSGWDEKSDTMIVAIADNGLGIPDDQIRTIFNMFESDKGARGTGIGLAVSRKIIQEHGGRIEVESREGVGSRFVLSWPRLDEEPRLSESETGPKSADLT